MFGTGITRLISNTFQQAGLLAGGREVGEVEIADADEQPIPPAARTQASRPPPIDLTDDCQQAQQKPPPASSSALDPSDNPLLSPPRFESQVQHIRTFARNPEAPRQAAPNPAQVGAEGIDNYHRMSSGTRSKANANKPAPIVPGASFQDEILHKPSSRKRASLGTPYAPGRDSGFSNTSSKPKQKKSTDQLFPTKTGVLPNFNKTHRVPTQGNPQAGPSHTAARSETQETNLLSDNMQGANGYRQVPDPSGGAASKAKGKEKAQIIEIDGDEEHRPESRAGADAEDNIHDNSFAQSTSHQQHSRPKPAPARPRASAPTSRPSSNGSIDPSSSSSSAATRRHSMTSAPPPAQPSKEQGLAIKGASKVHGMKKRQGGSPDPKQSTLQVHIQSGAQLKSDSRQRHLENIPQTLESNSKAFNFASAIFGKDSTKSQRYKSPHEIRNGQIAFAQSWLAIKKQDSSADDHRIFFQDVEVTQLSEPDSVEAFLRLTIKAGSHTSQALAERFQPHFSSSPSASFARRSMRLIFPKALTTATKLRNALKSTGCLNPETLTPTAIIAVQTTFQLPGSDGDSSCEEDVSESARRQQNINSLQQRGGSGTGNGKEAKQKAQKPSSFYGAPTNRETRASARQASKRQTMPMEIDADEEEDVGHPTEDPDDFPITSTKRPTGPQEPADKVLLIYPWDEKGGITITHGDLRRLETDEYLNDTLIEFGLKFIQREIRSRKPELADQIHFFNTFFFKKLSTKAPRSSKAADSYESVMKWTKNMDIFEKKYIVVPINEHMHWFLSIIVNPAAILQPSEPKSSQPKRASKRVQQPAEEKAADPPEEAPARPEPNRTTSETLLLQQPHQRSGSTESSTTSSTLADKAAASRFPAHAGENSVSISDSEDELAPETILENADRLAKDLEPLREKFFRNLGSEKQSPSVHATPKAHSMSEVVPESPLTPQRASSPPAPTESKEPADSNEISAMAEQSEISSSPSRGWSIAFDSLGGSHATVHKTLKTYFKKEANTKKGLDDQLLGLDHMKGVKAQVPQQTNWTDCGLFVLRFVEAFFSDPEQWTQAISEQALQRHKSKGAELPWQGKELYDRRDIMRQTILDLAKEWEPLRREQEERDRQHKEEKKRKRQAKIAAEDQTSKEASVDGQTAPSRPETPPPAEAQAESAADEQTSSRAIVIEDDDDSTTASSPAKQAKPLVDADPPVNLAPEYGSDDGDDADPRTLQEQPDQIARPAANAVQSLKGPKRPRVSADLTTASHPQLPTELGNGSGTSSLAQHSPPLHAKRRRLSESPEVETSSSALDASHPNFSQTAISAIDPSLLKESNGPVVTRAETHGSEVSSSSGEEASRPYEHERPRSAAPEERSDITQLAAHMFEDPSPASAPRAETQELSPDSPRASPQRPGGRIPIELD